MTALTAGRDTPKRGAGALLEMFALPQKGSTIIYPGAMVALSAGLAIPAKTAPGLKVVGVFAVNPDSGTYSQSDSTGLADSALTVYAQRGVYPMNNSSGADLIAAANVEQDCYAVDDNTVALTDGGNGARSRAGKIVDVDSVTGQVWVEFGVAKDGDVKIIPLGSTDLASITAATIKAAQTMPFGGTIVGFYAVVGKAATTGAKLATLTPQITPAGGAATSITGGALALTSANCTPLGNNPQASAVTGANTFKAGDAISILASAVTAFIEGNVDLFLIVGP